MSDLSDPKLKIKQPLYSTWRKMLRRCNDPKYEYFHRYGGRGIKVCKEWLDYFTFEKDLGVKPGKNYSIERIDNDGDYSAANVRWATQKEQCNNRSTNRPIAINGIIKNLNEWCFDIGLSPAGVLSRIKKGWEIEKALTTPRLKNKPISIKRNHTPK